MVRAFVALFAAQLALAAFAQSEGGPRSATGPAPYNCDANACRPPNCRCASPVSPLGPNVPRDNIPQFVTFTADDAVQSYTVDTVNGFLGNRRNPNSCPVSMTYFVSLNYTDYHLVTNYYSNQSYEIADHTMTHVFPVQDEVNGNLLALNSFAGIPLSAIQGFRAPFLNYSGASLELLGRSQFRYDSSSSTGTRANATNTDAYWPYTLDHGLANDCDLVPEACNGGISVPGMWEIPMYAIFEDETAPIAHLMDPWLDDTSSDHSNFVRWLQYTFQTHYNGNRQPFGLYTHPIHLASNYPGVVSPTAMISALNEFLDWVQTFNNVWIVNNQQLLDWMQNPVPADQLNNFAPLRCQTPNVDGTICNGLNDETENVLVNCPFSDFPWRTCYGCPVQQPTPADPVPAQATGSGYPRYHLPANCSTQFFDPIQNRCLCNSDSCSFIDQSKPIGPNGAPVNPGGTGSSSTSSATATFKSFGGAIGLGVDKAVVALATGLVGGGMILGALRLL